MKIGLVVPWREQPSRIKPFQTLMKWYENNMPDVSIYLSDRDTEIWHCSGSRNDGVAMAEADGCDVVIVNDADTIPELEPLLEAIEAAYKDKYIHNPYKHYRMLGPEGTEEFFNGTAIEDCTYYPFDRSISGLYVCKPSSWWAVGGQDEKFWRWGPEDSAMARAHKVIHGKSFIKHFGTVYALGHEYQKMGDAVHLKNKRLWMQYGQIKGPERMLKFVQQKEWNG